MEMPVPTRTSSLVFRAAEAAPGVDCSDPESAVSGRVLMVTTRAEPPLLLAEAPANADGA